MAFLDDLFGLAGKTALVTGGATGLGRMAVEGLAMAGARVLLCSRKGEACVAAAAEVNTRGGPGRAEGFAGDAGSAAGVAAIVREVAARADRLDILVNNAGKSWGEPFETFPWKAWEGVMSLNVTGLFTLTRDLVPMLAAAATADDPARIVNLGSVMGERPLADGAYSYSASKAAVHHLTRILAKELAGRQVTVNALAPGPFPSRMTAFATADPARRAKVAAGIPMGRVGRPDDLVGALLFLCGRAGAYTTGAILPLDGGIGVATGPELFPEVEG